MALKSVNYSLYHNAESGEYNIKENLDSSGTEQVQVYRGQIYDFGDESYPIDIAEIAKHYITLDDINISLMSSYSDYVIVPDSLGTIISKANGMYFLCDGGLRTQYSPSAYSYDGIIWYPTNRPTNDFRVNYCESRVVYNSANSTYYCATGQSSTYLMRSTDGINWSILRYSQDQRYIVSDGIRTTVVGGSLFYINVYDLNTNTLSTKVSGVTSRYPIFDGTRFLLFGVIEHNVNSGLVYTASSSSPNNWSLLANNIPGYFLGAMYVNGYYIIGVYTEPQSRDFSIYSTTDFVTYTQIQTKYMTIDSLKSYHSNGSVGVFLLTHREEGVYKNTILYTTNGTSFLSKTFPDSTILNSVFIDGDKILYRGTKAKEGIVGRINVGSSDDLIVTRQIRDLYIDNNPKIYTVAYDYNTEYIKSWGPVSNRNQPITGEVIEGQNLFFSLYDEQWDRSKEIIQAINGDSVTTRTTDARCSHAIFTVPEIDKGNLFTLESTVSDETMVNEYKIVDDCNIRYIVYYINKLGGIDSLLIKGNTIESYNNDQYQINGIYDRSTPSEHQRRTLQNTVEKRWQMNTGLLTDDQASRIDHLLLSPKLWVHDLETGLQYAANILDNAFSTAKFRDNTRFVSYTFNLVQAQDIIRRG